MDAMGKPFQLGMLYDATTNQIIPGMSLWDIQTIENATLTQSHQGSYTEMHSSDSVRDKLDILDISAELYIGITSAETSIEITGKAAYVDSKTSSSSTKSIATSYTSYSHFSQLTQSILREDSISYAENIESSQATHIVTGILFGNGAILDFSLEASAAIDIQNINGYLNLVVKSSNFELDAEASLELQNSQSLDTSDISVNFYADFFLEKNPSSYEEAISLLHNTKDTVEKSSPVPMIVYLQPLSAYSNNAKKYVKMVNYLSQNRYIDIIKYLQSALLTCSELKVSLHGKFPFTYNTVSSLESKIESYLRKFKASVANVLPTTKEGKATSNSFEDIISNHNSSPFCKKCLKTIVSNLEILTKVLLTLTKKCEDVLGDDVKYYETISQSSKTEFKLLTLNTFIENDWSSDMQDYLNDENSQAESFSYDDTKLQVFLSALKGTMSTLKMFLAYYVYNGDYLYIVLEKQDVSDTLAFQSFSVDKNFKRTELSFSQMPSLSAVYTSEGTYEIQINSDDTDSSFNLYTGELIGTEIQWKLDTSEITDKIIKVSTEGIDSRFFGKYLKVTAVKNSIESPDSNTAVIYRCIDKCQYESGCKEPVCRYINECETNTANCPAHSTCYDTRLSYGCNCVSGYITSGDKCIRVSCSRDDFENGQIEGGNFYNDMITYKCNTKYRLIGQRTRRCSYYGWSGTKPICELITCSRDDFENGQIEGGNISGDTITYSCNTKYRLIGQTTRRCGLNGWSGTKPKCEIISCSRDDFANGQIEGGNIYGDMITYSCNSKYRLIGQTTRTCGLNGWSGTKPKCEVISCSRDDFENGQIEGGNIIDDTITYSCNTNYRLIGQTTRTCGLDGWSGTKPKCEESYCEVTFRTHNNVRYENYACSDGTENCIISYRKVKVGTSIKKTCINSNRYMANSENAINKCVGHLTWQHQTKQAFCYIYCAKLWENNNDKGDIWQIKESKYTDLTRSDNWDLNHKNIDNDDIEQYQLWTGCNLKFWKNQSWKSHETSEMKWMYYSTKGNGKNWVPSGWGGKITAVQCWCN